MAANFANWSEDNVINWLLGAAVVTRPTAWNVALYTAAPGEDGLGGTEVAGGGYARQAATLAALTPILTPEITVTYDGTDSVISVPLADTATDAAAIGAYHWMLLRLDEGSEHPIAERIMRLKATPR